MNNAPTTLKDKQMNLKSMLEKMKPQMAEVLPKHVTPERMAKTAMIAANQNPDLLSCEIPSVLQSVMTASSLGLDVGGSLGSAYLVPFNKNIGTPEKKIWEKRCQLIIGYRGLIDLARRSGQISRIEAHVVYEGEEFRVEYGLEPILIHKPMILGERGPVIAAYAVAELRDGSKQCEVMTREDLNLIRDNTQSKGEWGPWRDHPQEMARKTVVRRLAKYLPLSAELQTALTAEDDSESMPYTIDVEVGDAPPVNGSKSERIAGILDEDQDEETKAKATAAIDAVRSTNNSEPLKEGELPWDGPTQ